MQNYIDGSFENTTSLLTCSMGKHYLVKQHLTGKASQTSSLRQLSLMAAKPLRSGRDRLYWLSRNTTHAPSKSARGSSGASTPLSMRRGIQIHVPFSIAYNGPLMYYHFSGSTFIAASVKTIGHGRGFDPANPNTPRFIRSMQPGAATAVIPDVCHFQDWLVGIYEGAIITTTKPPITANWGYISNLTSPHDGSAIWADIVWVNGAKPTSGFIYRGCKVRRLLFASNNVFAPGTRWSDPGFLKETGPGVSYGFPAGYRD